MFVYFDNDQKSAAPADARRLRELTASGLTPAELPGTSHPIGRLTLNLILDRSGFPDGSISSIGAASHFGWTLR